jgi:glycine dehydrogenase
VRELKKYYISASEEELSQMLKESGHQALKDIYTNFPPEILFQSDSDLNLPSELDYEQLADLVFKISCKNNQALSFIGDGLPHYKIPPIVKHVAGVRGLSTAYTPYQPERSQGSLIAAWLYQCSIAMLTGFEAINASMYDRATCLFEAANCALRLVRGSDTVILSEGLYPGDIEVVNTLAAGTRLNAVTVNLDPDTGRTDLKALKEAADKAGSKLAAIIFPQVNCLGNIENVNEITDFCREKKIQSIACIDPMQIATDGLKPPAEFGSEGAGIFVAEGQHLALEPNFGGPGLGIFGIRYNEKNKNSIRSAAGRFIGEGLDLDGRTCKLMVLSTREQHIRKEKATSNICSNEAFIATLAGASILGRGEKGMSEACVRAHENARKAFQLLTRYKDVKPAFAQSPFFNEFVLELPCPAGELIQKACVDGLHIGVDVTARIERKGSNLLMLSFSDRHTEDDLAKLDMFFRCTFGEPSENACQPAEVPAELKRSSPVNLPSFTQTQLSEYYTKLGNLNVSPDHGPYPLGSCTMKYNPYINDYTADFPGFTTAHPQAPESEVQGCLEILYHTQEIFCNMLGLSALTTQPVAGAQGELAGIKMFQAWHRDNSKTVRDILLIPRTAHGTNFATAAMAGFELQTNDKLNGIQLVEAGPDGQIDIEQLRGLVERFGERIAGIMITNPNTSGIAEIRFAEIAGIIHGCGGLVYMDGANLNAISGWLNLGKMGVDAVHSNLHKTWSIAHGGGGPGDAFVAVSEKLRDYLPGLQVIKTENGFKCQKPARSIGSFHRHFGNFAHKVRCYTYLRALGDAGVRKMSAVAVLSARYCYSKLREFYPSLPERAEKEPRMHEFILTISEADFKRLENCGIAHSQAIIRIGKLFLDFGLHAPTVAFPEVYGLMVEPTESYAKHELDRFVAILQKINWFIKEMPEVLHTVPHFTPVNRIDEVSANKNLKLFEKLKELPEAGENIVEPGVLHELSVDEIAQKIITEHRKRQKIQN